MIDVLRRRVRGIWLFFLCENIFIIFFKKVIDIIKKMVYNEVTKFKKGELKMKIEINKNYKVEKYIHKENDIEVSNYGMLPGSDVKSMLKGYKYDEDFEMWFSRKANIAYDVQEVK